MRGWMLAYTLGAAVAVVGCDAILDMRRSDVLRRFEAICRENAGLAVDRAVGQGGVRTDLALGETLWLLFDFDAPLIEYQFQSSPSWIRLFEEWSPPTTGAWILRAERVLRGDPACDVFDAWRSRLAEERLEHDGEGPDAVSIVLPSRWRNADAYRSHCLKLTFLSPDQIDSHDTSSPPHTAWRHTRYQLTAEHALHDFTGPWFIEERRYALVEGNGQRAFTITALTALSVPAGAPNVILESCGDPTKQDLSADGRWFEIDDFGETGRFEIGEESARLNQIYGRRLD